MTEHDESEGLHEPGQAGGCRVERIEGDERRSGFAGLWRHGGGEEVATTAAGGM